MAGKWSLEEGKEWMRRRVEESKDGRLFHRIFDQVYNYITHLKDAERHC